MMNTVRKSENLLPFPVISAAANGDTTAMCAILKHYEGYIAKLCTRTLKDDAGNTYVEKCKNELLHKAIEDSIQKAQVLTTAANVKLGEIQAIDYSWGEIDFVTKPLNEMRLMECTECEMSAPGAYDIDIEADDINVIDTATVIWEIA